MPAIGRNLRGALLALGAFAVFASHDAAIKALGAHYHAAQIVFFSALFGLPAALMLVIRDRAPASLWPRDPMGVALRSGAVVVGSLCSFFAFSAVPMAQAYAIFFSTPILVTLLAIPLLGERVGLRRAVAIVVGLVGVLIVLRPGQAALGVGHLSALGGALASSLVAIMTRRLGGSERMVVLLVYPMLGNIAVMGLLQFLVYRPVEAEHLLLMISVAFAADRGVSGVRGGHRRADAVFADHLGGGLRTAPVRRGAGCPDAFRRGRRDGERGLHPDARTGAAWRAGCPRRPAGRAGHGQPRHAPEMSSTNCRSGTPRRAAVSARAWSCS